MTIIQPNKNKELKRLVIILSVVLISTFAMNVFVYLETVNAKHDLSRVRDEVEKLKVDNAELKNEYYALVDTENLERLAAERGFVQDKNPQWALALPY